MAGTNAPRVAGLVLIAGAVTLVVTLLRLFGELLGWSPIPFSAAPGGGASVIGIVWLVPVFGFLFGRRLAGTGAPPPFVRAFFVPMFAVVALVFAIVTIDRTQQGEDLLRTFRYVLFAAPVLALLGLFAWPRAFGAALLYAALARLPVCAVQYFDIANGWQTHYGKVHPEIGKVMTTADERLFGLTMAQLMGWIPFTVLLACGFAALGAATVRRS